LPRVKPFFDDEAAPILSLQDQAAEENMLPMKKFFFVLTVAIVSGCASVKTVSVKVTEPRPAIPVKDVQLMLSVPTNAVLAAYIYADSCCSSGRGADAAQAQLKEKAAAIGANALVIRTWEPTIDFSPADRHFRIEANAFFVQ